MAGHRKFAGLIKFFGVETHLDALLDGLLYCNAPEFYRLHEERGISDRNESCMHSFRQSRGDAPIKFTWNGQPIEGITAATTHIGGRKDMWLHCWTALDFPENNNELESLTHDLQRLADEFGMHYAYLSPKSLKTFSDRLRGATTAAFEYGRVVYSNDQTKWSVGCKSSQYAYQREYRFAVGVCSHTCVEPLRLTHPTGFRDCVVKDPVLEMKGDGVTFFRMGLSGES
jgi:hypothetical protein